MANRRSFLTGLFATGLVPKSAWADAGNPAFLSAGMTPEGTYALYGLRRDGSIAFKIAVPDRAHAAATHPHRPEAVAFARRPGRFAIVLDCAAGLEIARLSAPSGRHFYGHGAFSPDGLHLFTTENDYEAARGIIGIWDARRGYKRVGEMSSGGLGPHDIKSLPGHEKLVIANGGIETHPDTGRTKLNLATMKPNLTYIDLEGRMVDRIELDPGLHKASIRHLAVNDQGSVAFAMQWQGDLSKAPPLLGLHQPAKGVELVQGDPADTRRMQSYAGSIAITRDGHHVAITSPRGGVCQVFATATAELADQRDEPDICGVAAHNTGFVTTAGTGQITELKDGSARPLARHRIMWDNHLIALPAGQT